MSISVPDYPTPTGWMFILARLSEGYGRLVGLTLVFVAVVWGVALWKNKRKEKFWMVIVLALLGIGLWVGPFLQNILYCFPCEIY